MEVSGKGSVAFGKAPRIIIITFGNLIAKNNRVVKPKYYQVILR